MAYKAAGRGSKEKILEKKLVFDRGVGFKVGTEDLHTQTAPWHLTRQLISPTAATHRMDFSKYLFSSIKLLDS